MLHGTADGTRPVANPSLNQSNSLENFQHDARHFVKVRVSAPPIPADSKIMVSASAGTLLFSEYPHLSIPLIAFGRQVSAVPVFSLSLSALSLIMQSDIVIS